MAVNKVRTFFFMATLQVPDPRGVRVQNVWGTVGFDKPMTRHDTITWFAQTYLPQIGMEGANITFWQCEPNDYPPAG